MNVKPYLKTIIVCAALSFICGKMQAQTTGEAFIKQCPELPSAANLAEADFTENKAVTAFRKKISNLREQLENETERAKEAFEEAEKSDQERVEKQFDSSSLKKLENKSEEEIMAMVLSGGSELSSLMADAMKMVSGEGRMESVMELAKGPEMQMKIMERWFETDRLNQTDKAEVVAKIVAIREKYETLMKAVPCTGLGGETGPTYTQAEQAKIQSYEKSERLECYTLWRPFIAKMQERIKSRLADVPALDKLGADAYTAAGYTASVKTMISHALEIAEQYLDITATVTELP